MSQGRSAGREPPKLIFVMADALKPVSQSGKQSHSGFEGMGRWVAVASELPCTVIAMMFAGQIIGQSVWGLQGSTWGAVIGAITGFALGVYGVYVTVRFYEGMEQGASQRRAYRPSVEEITEDVEFDVDNGEQEETSR